MEFSDTHCHLDFNKFDDDRMEVIQRAQAAGLSRILVPGISVHSSEKAVELAGNHSLVYASIGVQPNEAPSWEGQSINNLKKIFILANKFSNPAMKKVCAIGEIGLDYYWDVAVHELQQVILWEQMLLAAELGLPVILHMREEKDATNGSCSEDLLKILSDWMRYLKSTNNPLVEHPGVIHSFSGNLDTAEKAIRMGFFIGVTGPVTYLNNKERQDLVAALPLNRILLETDAPFLPPQSNRGQRNEPSHIPIVAAKVAELHGITLAEVAEITSTNAKRLFSW